MNTFKAVSIIDLPAAGEALFKIHPLKTKFLLYAEMGVGKTTFIKELCKQLGYNKEVQSPTYGIVNEYPLPNENSIFHIDLYRLNSIEEALDIGIENYLYHPTAYCFIEWPNIIEPILPNNFIKINIETNPSNHRIFYF